MGQRLGRNRQGSIVWAIALIGGLIGAIDCVGFTAAAQAARLQFWRFDASSNRLEFTTDDTVQPRVQLIPNPVRLVVDLPGIQLNRPTVNQAYNAAVRSVRVGQVDAQTARIVVELAPGYTVDPQQVKVRGASPISWSIDLPTPQVWQSTSTLPEANTDPSAGSGTPSEVPTPSVPPRFTPSPRPTSDPVTTTAMGGTTLDDILVIPTGFLLKTRQPIANAQVRRSSNRREVSVELSGVTASRLLARNAYKLNFHGVQRVEIEQVSVQPPVARVTLRVDRRSPDWQASIGPEGGLMLLPQGGSAAIPNSVRPSENISLLLGRSQPSSPSTASTSTSSRPVFSGNQQLALVQNIALGGSQLLVQANRPVYYTVGWEGQRYRITIRGAQASSTIREPQTGPGSALSEIELRQDGPNLNILLTPSSGVRMGAVSRVDAQTVILGLTRLGTTATIPTVPSQPQLPPPGNSGFQQPTLSRPNSRRIVVIDPGHGGPDVGAVGIGGLRETNVVLPISLEVARLLQQQGLQVYLTRTDESRDVDLPPRVALAEQVRADVFVSIHANAISLSRPDINGAETYYAPGSTTGAELAQVILNSIIRNVNIPSRGVHSARFYVIRKTSMPATLVETGFVTGAQDAPKLGDPTFQRQMAAAIAQGIIEFLNRR